MADRARCVILCGVIDLHWIPLGAGGHCVRFNGRVYEALIAARERRPRRALYHAALTVDGHAIEVGPSPDDDLASRGVVATGAVGSRYLGRWRLFRYEVRCGESIPDLAWAVSTIRVSADPAAARRVLDALPAVPRPVWGRDEFRTGEMWNSNSVVAWVLATAGVPTAGLRPPPHGRAPGWDGGIEVARRVAEAMDGGTGDAPALHELMDRIHALGVGAETGVIAYDPAWDAIRPFR